MDIKPSFLYKAKVLEIIDGDTIEILLDIGFKTFRKEKIRFYGVDTPESRTTDLAEKEKGLKVKEWVRDKLENKEIIIESIKQEKYGRYLGKIYLDNLCINDELIRLNMAVPYFGEKR